MQFVRNGPDVPERLLQAHEDGSVVFFCGAGISFPAGLPSFGELVKNIYDYFKDLPSAEQKAAIKAKQFDTAIGLLENELVNGRTTVREKLAKILTPNLDSSNATATHEALLTLSRNSNGGTRLVTTNFDRLFEEVIDRSNLEVVSFSAPLLPVPKRRWEGLVYLHGLLPRKPTDRQLDELVVSSGDFGLAYLTERWAARFVSEMFRNFTVCIVGYSINDPVLRYMTDALAADRLLGEPHLEVFAFGSYSKGRENERASEWKAKNVTPILYRMHKNHWYLHKTLRAWAEIHRDGITGKDRIIDDHANLRPLTSTKQDDFVGRVLWALSDPSGLPAKRFANYDPVPSLDWLDAFSERRFRHSDLRRFGVIPNVDDDDGLEFSIISRPCPYTNAPWMTLVDYYGLNDKCWDKIMYKLADWLIRHLDDPALVLWLVKRSGRLIRMFADSVEQHLKYLDMLESNNEFDKLERIRANARRAVPRPIMRTLWRLLLAEKLKSPLPINNIYHWLDRFGRDGLTTVSRLELRELLSPCVLLREPFLLNGILNHSRESARLRDLVDWEIILTSDNVHYALRKLRKSSQWPLTLPKLLDDFNTLLRDTMDLKCELGGVDDKRDLSYIVQPSISDHPQNRRIYEWTALIELARDAWIETVKIDPDQARRIAESWILVPYPVFRRLALYAAAQNNVISTRQGLDWLLTDDHYWLWSVETQREAIRLLVKLVPELNSDQLTKLEQVILEGPPRSMYQDDIQPVRWVSIVGSEIWLRLAKMDSAGANLRSVTRKKMEELQQHPTRQLAADDSDEFPSWVGEASEWQMFIATPRQRRELVHWLKQYPKGGNRWDTNWQDDDWSQRCHNNFSTTACALCALAKDGEWLSARWHEALSVWSTEKHAKRSWRYMAFLLVDSPDDILLSLARSVGRWLKSVAKTFDHHQEVFFKLCKRILELEYQNGSDEEMDNSVSRAINHPVGHVVEALLNWWFRNSLEDSQGLPDEINPIFTTLCDVRVGKFRHGRVLLASRVVTLFRVDREWTECYLLKLFDWSNEIEARAAWEGFLWSPRIHRPLLESIKRPFLDTARNYEKLDTRYGTNYVTLLTFIALERDDCFTNSDLRTATAEIPIESLQHVANAIERALEGAGEQRTEYWHNRVQPYLQTIWSRSRARMAPDISESLSRVCIAAQNAFPEALVELRPWLQPLQHPDYLVNLLNEAELCSKFPGDTLEFLSVTTGEQLPTTRDLKSCLEQIRVANPELNSDPRFRNLWNLIRQAGQD